MQMQTAAFQRIAQIAGAVGGEQNDRWNDRADGADFRDCHLIVGQDLQQESLKFLVGLVDLVDQQDRPTGFLQGPQQGAWLEELFREKYVPESVQLVQRRRQVVRIADDRVDLVLEDLGVQQLLAVFPLVQCLGLV